nr:glutathione S-transferase family protein [uncultured Sphingomonas sp.]
MITIWGGQISRSIRVVWLLEEMGLPYEVRQVDMLAEERDLQFLALNPADYIPVLQDGPVTMVESIAIMEYLLARHGPTPLAPAPHDPGFPAYQQFLHLGEAGLATLMMPAIVSRFVAPPAERDNWAARWCLQSFRKRVTLVERRLAEAPYLAGDRFTAADISVTYAFMLGQRHCDLTLSPTARDYLARTTGRDAYGRALERSHEGVATS